MSFQSKKNIKPQVTPPPPLSFPPAWLWLIDEAIPAWVKKNYSPRESWKDKLFSPEDSRFFLKGIHELSELFTEERPRGMPAYFLHPKYRSSYLLYFFPLQAAKFLTIFQLHPGAIEAALNHGEKTGTLKVVDLGAGPGTASISFLLFLLQMKLAPGKKLPLIEMDWFDTNSDIMEDGKTLVEQLSSHFPRLRGKVQIRTHVQPWWKAASFFKEDLSLVFMGHLLNESSAPQNESEFFWNSLLHRANGGGVLMVEPAARKSSQLLSSLRDGFFQSEMIEDTPSRIWGPCLHSQGCPLAQGRDWCHFSIPISIPGKWFKIFSKSLSSERQWVKFSYLWIASSEYPSPKTNPRLRRVISDPLQQGPQATVLICEPEKPGRWKVPPNESVWRGDLVKIS